MSSGLSSDGEPRRVSAAIVLATIVTLAAAIPLGVVAFQARSDDGPAPADGLVINEGTTIRPLSGAVIAQGPSVTIEIDDDSFVAAAWALYTDSGELIAKGNNVGAPPYVVETASDGAGVLQSGLYDLLVTATQSDGTVIERAARFAVS